MAKKKQRSADDLEDETYSVQFVIVREVVVKAGDELQAERVAYATLNSHDKLNAMALKVLEEKDKCGALESEDPMDNWKFARENFETIDRSWVEE